MRFAIVAALVATAAVIWMRRHLVRVVVDGPSMEPAFSSGSRLLIRRVVPGVAPVDVFRPGVVVVLEAPAVGAPAGAQVATGLWVVKRVAAGPGDPLPPAVAAAIGAPPGSRVPAGYIAVLGDNPDASVDSRHYGPVPLERVLGVALDRHEPRRGGRARH